MSEEEKTTTVVTTPDNKRPRRTSIIRGYYPYGSFPSTGRHLFNLLLTLLLLAGLTALVLYLVYRPSKPRFSVSSAAIYDLGTSTTSQAPGANVVSTSMQFTLIARNPNDRGSILYDRLSAYVSYRGQPITPPVPLPPLAQDRDSAVAVSPVLGGAYVPVSGEAAAGLKVDRGYGVVGLRVVLMGRLKYKTGPFRSAWTGLYVRCDVLVGVRKGVAGQVPLIGEPQCKVDA